MIRLLGAAMIGRCADTGLQSNTVCEWRMRMKGQLTTLMKHNIKAQATKKTGSMRGNVLQTGERVG